MLHAPGTYRELRKKFKNIDISPRKFPETYEPSQ